MGVSRSAYSPYWTAKQIYRLYQSKEAGPLELEGINIRFFEDDRTLTQPRLIVGRVAYTKPPIIDQSWDFDDGYYQWCNAQDDDLGKVLMCNNESNWTTSCPTFLGCVSSFFATVPKRTRLPSLRSGPELLAKADVPLGESLRRSPASIRQHGRGSRQIEFWTFRYSICERILDQTV
jgi:hypothetical protein